MEELPLEILNDKPFSLYINIYLPEKEPKVYYYPSLNMELLLSKIFEHLNGRVGDTKLQDILEGIAIYNGDMIIELKQGTVYISEVSAKDLYKPRKIIRE